MQGQYSMRSPAVKRLMKEAQELSEPTEQYYAQPLDDNLFEWHFTIRGPSESDFDGGIYHGRIVLPPEYPMKPPSIILLTPNGRFETNKKICLSISGHHPESWQPSWSIRTALLAIIGFMPTHGAGAIGSLDYCTDERKKLARRSLDYKCPTCGGINYTLKAVTAESEKTKQEAKELAAQINFQGEKEKKENGNSSEKNGSEASPQTGSNSEKPTAWPYPQMSMPAGQMPFTRFPFPPPFMSFPGFPQTTQSGSATVPRFPPPPPFIPAMFPPGFMQNMAASQQGNMNFFMPPWPGNPYMASQTVSSAAPSSETTSAVNSQRDTRVSGGNAAGSESEISPSKEGKGDEEPMVDKDTVDSGQDADVNGKETSDKETSEQTGTDLENSGDQANSDTNVTESVSNVNDNVPVSESEEPVLRHRTFDADLPRPHVPSGRVGQSAELEDHQRHSGSTFSTVLITLIGIAIALLLLRRFFLSRNWKFYYGY